jgi:phenylalanine-4-hydroxylase
MTIKMNQSMEQNYSLYTPEDHQVWSILYKNQMELLPAIAAEAYLHGISNCGFQADRVPQFSEVNKALESMTGWSIYVVPGLIDNKPFFEHLSRKEFPATTWLRSLSQLKYLEEPDMFHDVFGHIPLLSEQFFCDYLQGLSAITLEYIDNDMVIEIMARLYWYTVEFGLIHENHQIKIYGAGILSSSGECQFAVSPQANHIPFDVVKIMDTPYVKDKFQSQYFVIQSYKDLFDSLDQVRSHINHVLHHSFAQA